MATPGGHPEPNPKQARPTLFWVMLGLIIVLLGAFLVLRPHPAEAPTRPSHAGTP